MGAAKEIEDIFHQESEEGRINEDPDGEQEGRTGET